MTTEAEVNCPFCGEFFSTVVDCSEENQDYIEDCFVCCKPIHFHVKCADGELINIECDR